jgi:hypothetical protein
MGEGLKRAFSAAKATRSNAKLQTTFDAVRELITMSRETTRTIAKARIIGGACLILDFNAADTFRMFAYLEYADMYTGLAYPYAHGKNGIQPGEVFWDFEAYQADMKKKGK